MNCGTCSGCSSAEKEGFCSGCSSIENCESCSISIIEPDCVGSDTSMGSGANGDTGWMRYSSGDDARFVSSWVLCSSCGQTAAVVIECRCRADARTFGTTDAGSNAKSNTTLIARLRD